MRAILRSAFCVAFASTAAAQGIPNVPTRTLTKSEVEVREPLSWLEEGVRELRDGRVIVIVGVEDVLKIVDLDANTVALVSRKGNGPGEYRAPNALYPLPGDSTAVLEASWRQMLVILPNGKPGGFLNPRPTVPGGLRGPSENVHVQRVDGRGRYYGTGPTYRNLQGAIEQIDSIAILRWTPASVRMDTVGYVAQPKNNVSASTRGRAQMIRVGGGGGPFGPRDHWTVAPDGRVAVVSATTYGITWTDPVTLKRTTTPPIPFQKYAVSDAYKKQWMDQQRQGGGGAACGDDGSCTTIPRFQRQVQEPKDWGGELLPPFRAEALSFSPDGTLWVKRTGAFGAPLTYDLIDSAGKITQRVTFPAGVRLIGFGASGAIYAARTDDDDLQYLQRYRLK